MDKHLYKKGKYITTIRDGQPGDISSIEHNPSEYKLINDISTGVETNHEYWPEGAEI